MSALSFATTIRSSAAVLHERTDFIKSRRRVGSFFEPCIFLLLGERRRLEETEEEEEEEGEVEEEVGKLGIIGNGWNY